jgi:hypothetical protein
LLIELKHPHFLEAQVDEIKQRRHGQCKHPEARGAKFLKLVGHLSLTRRKVGGDLLEHILRDGKAQPLVMLVEEVGEIHWEDAGVQAG